MSLGPEPRLSQHCESLQMKRAIMALLLNIWISIKKTFFSSYLDIQSFYSVLTVCKEQLTDEYYSVLLHLSPPLRSQQPNIYWEVTKYLRNTSFEQA